MSPIEDPSFLTPGTGLAHKVMETVSSWGRLGRIAHAVARPAFVDEARSALVAAGPPMLCYGMGRSYGDVCLNENGRLLVTDRLDRILAFDRDHGIVLAEAGLTIDRLLRVIVPHGWFVPVSPGTKFVTLGGAVANDVHGKNHETAGTFGAYVRSLGLARSSGETLTLSRDQHPALFAATIGGLGLTGVILWIELALAPIRSAFIDSETIPMADLDAFFRLAAASRDWPYTVAWVDCLAKGMGVGRGFFIRGRHAETGGLAVHRAPRWVAPVEAPGGMLNARTIGAFNALYSWRACASARKTIHYDRFFYPLDSIHRWNRLYGARGFFQHQSVVPMVAVPDTMRKLLALTAEQGEGSFLVVLKLFGDRPSEGVLSFPMPGATLALDFPNKGEGTRKLLARMAEVVLAAGGRLYPAKDATMSAAMFRASYAYWRKVEDARDPAIMSDFWRRVTAEAA
jgi:FAD/FMN-containing dehydrogenase